VIKDLYSKPVLIFGCGNTLLGDDGFGPAVIDHLCEYYSLPEFVHAVDAGTSIRDFLFDLLLIQSKPTHIFIIDALSQPDKKPGELFVIEPSQMPMHKVNDFSLHQHPSVNLLRELQFLCGVKVTVLGVQVKSIPQVIQTGLSQEVKTSIPKACNWILNQIDKEV
jgi:coenzyme F420 hydrogenase subunit delta